MITIMEKWIISALELGNSNFKCLLSTHLASYQPYTSGNCTPFL
jgi:hypothetical protein